MNSIDLKTKQKIIGVAKAVIPEAKVYLFGSRARKTHQERSDIDIAFDAGKPLDRVDVGEIRDMLNASHIPYNIDVVDVHSVNEEMRKEIFEEGILWSD